MLKRTQLFRFAWWALLALGLAASHGLAQSPLQLKVGDVTFTPGGFLDFTSLYRTTAVGSGIGTNFAAIPFNNATAGRMSEFRESAQNSRLTLKVSAAPGGLQLYTYLETDFLGNQPANVAVSSNSDTLRLRVFFLDLRRGNWEIAAGQDWSLLTPGKLGLSPMPSDVAYGQTVETNYQLGLTWARQPQFRLLYHVSPHWTAGVSLENGEPYIGGSSGAPQAVIPAAYTGQVNNGSSNFSAPGFTPDIIAKVAYDSDPAGKGLHLEVAGLNSNFRTFTPATGLTQRAAGGGLEADASLYAAPGFRLLANTFFGDGGGRYFFGTAPDLIVRQDGSVSPVLTRGGMAGFEWQALPTDMLYAYYGGLAIKPSFDLSGATPLGYGYPGASAAQNRSLQEATLGLNHTFWKSPKYGSISLMTQASYLVRTPFAVAAAAPKNAHTTMLFANLRFALP
ncbi:MAG: hypothetical protein ACTHJX_09710 [Terriglobales bacterium]